MGESATDTIALNFDIPITNPESGFTLPSMLSVASATLDTTSPMNSSFHAAEGRIFLTLQMSSGPIQRNYGSPFWGDFFSGMTPLPASARRYHSIDTEDRRR